MPSSTLKNTSPGFLRDFNFSALADGFIRKLFGEVERPAWMKFKITSALDAFGCQTIFRLIVDIDPQPTVDLGGTSGFRVGPKLRRRDFTVEFVVPDQVLVEFRAQLPEMFCGWLEKAIRENAHKFYELDPRIGWRREEKSDLLPASPLFDPPVPFSRTGEPFHVDGTQTEVRCPFCRELHEDGDSPLWGGTNLMWVHPHCWRRS